ncbi:hypothetical protein AAHA92_21863 [Salvia divinorum]|uniref:Uncharacterized protein n=1 Tax=Salvia divinorum TaxID=28513 RepID=A0ABD1GLU7_SALDI
MEKCELGNKLICIRFETRGSVHLDNAAIRTAPFPRPALALITHLRLIGFQILFLLHQFQSASQRSWICC